MTHTGNTRLAGVMGWPVKHSRSPLLHGHWLARHGIDGAYVPLAVAPENFAAALTALPQLGFRGTNITVPHKQSALALLDEIGEIDEDARRIGAVNTVVVGEDGRMRGSNTDAFGFMENIRDQAPDWQADAGSRDRDDALAKEYNAVFGNRIVVSDWQQRADVLAEANGLVNSTSLGMEGQPPLELDLARLPAKSLVNDIVYAPLETKMLQNANKCPLNVVDGLGMLLHQARPGFAAWFGTEPVVDDELRQVVLRDLGVS